MNIKDFIDKYYLHFNARELKDAAQGYKKFVDDGGTMVLSMAGALSTSEIGISLAEMIRQDKVNFVSCTGANLEEDVYNLVAHDKYEIFRNWRSFSVEDDVNLLNKNMNRITDTCVPEHDAMRVIEKHMPRIVAKRL